MRTKALIKSVGACAAACGALGLGASAAFGSAAQTAPAQYVPVINFPDSANDVGASVGADCPSWVGSDILGLKFTSGNAVEYRIDPISGQPNGGNAEGQAYLEGVVLDPGTGAVTDTYALPGWYSGHTHVWFGTNTNPNFGPTNDQNWFGETVSFNGTSADGSTISISASFGGGTSASGNTSDWLHVKVQCTGAFPSS